MQDEQVIKSLLMECTKSKKIQVEGQKYSSI